MKSSLLAPYNTLLMITKSVDSLINVDYNLKRYTSNYKDKQLFTIFQRRSVIKQLTWLMVRSPLYFNMHLVDQLAEGRASSDCTGKLSTGSKKEERESLHRDTLPLLSRSVSHG